MTAESLNRDSMMLVEEIQLEARLSPDKMDNLTLSECVERLKPSLATEYSAIFFVSKSYSNIPNNNFTNASVIPQLYITHDSQQAENFLVIPDPHNPLDAFVETMFKHDDWIKDWGSAPSTLNPAHWYNTGNFSGLHIDYCFAKPANQGCSVGVIYPFLALVIFMNMVKIVCFLMFIRMETSPPLGTLGDAIASFLNNPDAMTAEKPLIDLAETSRTVSPSYLSSIYPKSSKKFTKLSYTNKRNWSYGASRRRWVVTMMWFVPPITRNFALTR